MLERVEERAFGCLLEELAQRLAGEADDRAAGFHALIEDCMGSTSRYLSTIGYFLVIDCAIFERLARKIATGLVEQKGLAIFCDAPNNTCSDNTEKSERH